MGLKEQIIEDMKAAMRTKEQERLGAIRLLMAAMKQKEVDERIELTDVHVFAIVEKMIKQRKDSIVQFQAGGRDDLVVKEQAELDVLSTYMPALMSAEEIEKEVADAVAGAQGMKDMGKVMAVLKDRLAGRADMSAVSNKVKQALSNA